MKFTYQYRTGDNVLHDGMVNAADRDDAYAILKSRGIRPSRLVEAPGLFNKLIGKGKRWFVIVALAALSAALALRSKTGPVVIEGAPGNLSQRHQIYGDPAIIDEMSADGFSGVFTNKGERYLAAYAMPGSSTAPSVSFRSPDELTACLTNKIVFHETDPREVAELKAIVNGIKEELREYMSDGEGTAAMFMRRLEERQEEERLIYRRVQNELEAVNDPALWEERNRSLREMGIRTIPRPRRPAK